MSRRRFLLVSILQPLLHHLCRSAFARNAFFNDGTAFID